MMNDHLYDSNNSFLLSTLDPHSHSESLEIHAMDNKSRPFSSLSPAQRDALMIRARQARSDAIADAFGRLVRLLATLFGRRYAGQRAATIRLPTR
ncbi:MAG: hypothetical protein JNN33_14710 [Rhodospirillaceae bacterium]|nr:hypothetical protein [Rhodospirillaceae bacterium]